MVEFAAIVACVVLLSLAVFQFLLILGKPYGAYAWGGQHTVLPKSLRYASVSSIILYAVFSIIILNQSGIIDVINTRSWVHIALKVVTGYFFIGIPLNAISRSRPERMVMTQTVTVLAILFLIVALNN